MKTSPCSIRSSIKKTTSTLWVGNSVDINRDEQSAEAWFKILRDLVHPAVSHNTSPIKVAILDTGVNIRHSTIARAFDRKIIEQCRGFPDDLDAQADWNGHGTYVASVLLATAPRSVSLFIVRIVDDQGRISNADEVVKVPSICIIIDSRPLTGQSRTTST
jgi:subtilisin family serine protease